MILSRYTEQQFYANFSNIISSALLKCFECVYKPKGNSIKPVCSGLAGKGGPVFVFFRHLHLSIAPGGV